MGMRSALGFGEGGYKGGVEGAMGRSLRLSTRGTWGWARGLGEEGSEAGHEVGIGVQRGWA